MKTGSLIRNSIRGYDKYWLLELTVHWAQIVYQALKNYNTVTVYVWFEEQWTAYEMTFSKLIRPSWGWGTALWRSSFVLWIDRMWTYPMNLDTRLSPSYIEEKFRWLSTEEATSLSDFLSFIWYLHWWQWADKHIRDIFNANNHD